MTGTRSLTDFAQERGEHRRRSAWLEAALPPELLAEVVAGYKDGLGSTTITEWLRDEHGYTEATHSRVDGYLRARYKRST